MSNLEMAREDRVLRIALNRPEKRNALSSALCRELVAALREAEADPACGCILLAANGPVFSAGMDLDEALAPDAAAQTAVHQELFTFGSQLRKPVVAAVAGAALGGGLGLVVNAHVVVAAQGTSFGLTEIRLGMWPFIVFRPVATAIGERRALELSLTGRVFGTQEALQWGLVHHVAPAFEYDDRAASLAATIAGYSPEAVRRGLDVVYATSGKDCEEAARIGAEARARVFASADFEEGVNAFKEKRQPRWPSMMEG